MKYLRLRDHLLEVVDGLAPGDPLPPERTLAATLGASRMAVRKAVDELVTIGHAVRRPGVGTFVAAKHSQGLAVTSFSEDMRARGIAPGARTLAAGDGRPAGAGHRRRPGRSGRRLDGPGPAAAGARCRHLRRGFGRRRRGHHPGHRAPERRPGPLSPMLEILPLQQLAVQTALARGEARDSPRGLHKVTETL